MGVTSLVSEILLLSKMAKFPLRTMDYSPWSSKNLINRNWLKKFMQVGIDVTCMYTNFGGRDLSSFEDIATSKTTKFPFRGMDYSPWSSKKLIDWNWLKKFMHLGIDVTCMHTNFGWCDLSVFRDTATSMVGKGNLAVFESSNISKTREVMPTKIGVHI